MDKETLRNKSRFLSLILRHKPETINLQLDNEGWLNVNELIEKSNKHGELLDFDMLEYIVNNSDKQRFTFNNDKSKIRANQGHSIEVELDLQEKIPPTILYHGTVDKFVDSIRNSGIEKRSRNHVHLSAETETAIKVGSRKGTPVILTVNSGQMYKDGYKFYQSKNDVWLIDFVPKEYIN